MKLLLGIFFVYTAACRGAQGLETLKGNPPLLESLIFSRIESSFGDEEASIDSKSESEPDDAQGLSQKLIEEVEDPSSIDSVEKDLYIEEELLAGDIEKVVKGTEQIEKEKKKSDKDFDLGPNSIADVLGAPEPERESTFFSEDKSLFNEDDSLSADDELVNEFLL